MTRYQNPAIIFGGGINGLGLVRNLGRNSVDVYCVVDDVDPTPYSRYCKKCFVIPRIQEEKSVLRSFLKTLKKKLTTYALLFSTTDLFSLRLSELKEELEGDYCVLLPEARAVRTLVNKREFYQSLSSNQIPCPSTCCPKSTEDVQEISQRTRYPVFVKPSISQIFQRQFHRKGFLASSAKELVKYYLLASKFEIDVVFQEVIVGPAHNLYGIAGYFDRNSLPKALFAYRRIRSWPLIFGNTTLMESVPISLVASEKETLETYLRGLGYYGIMEAEFIRDPRDGIFKLLEVNARSWWQNSLPTKCGINIALISYLDSTGKKAKRVAEYKTGVKWIDLVDDLRSHIRMSDRMSPREWMSSLQGVNDFAYFSACDPLPCAMLPPTVLFSKLKEAI